MHMDSITPCRSLISDRFPIASFAISLPERRWFEVACATDPSLFHTDGRKRRSSSNFYSSRHGGLLHAPKGEGTFLVPSDQLRRFAGARRLYFALASYGDPRGRNPSFSIGPDALDRVPFVEISPDFTGRSLDRTRLRGESAPTEHYGAAASPLTWGGDAALEEARRSSPASETGEEPPYDDGYDNALWTTAAAGEEEHDLWGSPTSASPTPSTGLPTRIDGIDAYAQNNVRSWPGLVNAGMSFAILKTSEAFFCPGHSGRLIDGSFRQRRILARNAGLITGSYHYYRTTHPTLDQVADVLGQVERLQPGELAPSLDFEHDGNLRTLNYVSDGQQRVPRACLDQPNQGYRSTREALLGELTLFLETTEKALGRTPIIYSSYSCWRDVVTTLRSSDARKEAEAVRYIGDCPLWVITYYNDEANRYPWRLTKQPVLGRQPLPDPWREWTFWQYTDDTPPPLVNALGADGIDFDVFNGTIHQLRGLADLGRPSTYVVNGNPRIVYCDADGKVHLIERNGPLWSTRQLTDDNNLAAEDPTACALGTRELVFFRAKSDGHIYQLTRDTTAQNPSWQGPLDVTREMSGEAVVVGPHAFIADGKVHLVYWGDQGQTKDRRFLAQWQGSWQLLSPPTRLPPMSGAPVGYLHENRAHTVSRAGADGHLWDVWLDGSDAVDLTDAASGKPATYRPAVYADLTGATKIVYRACRGHIHQIDRGSFLDEDLSAMTGAPTAAGSPAVFVDATGPHIVFRAKDGHVHELYFRGNDWQHRDVTEAARGEDGSSAPLAAADPATYVASGAGYVVFLEAQGQHCGLWLNGDRWSWARAASGQPGANPASQSLGSDAGDDGEEPCDGQEDAAQVRAAQLSNAASVPEDEPGEGYEDAADVLLGNPEAPPDDGSVDDPHEDPVDVGASLAATDATDEDELGEGYEDAQSLYGAATQDAQATASLRDADYADEIEEEIVPRGRAAQALGTVALDIPEKVRLLRLVAQAESGAAGYSATNPDREYETPGHPAYHRTHLGLSWGFVQFMQRSGNLGLVLRAAHERSEALRAQGRMRAGQSFEELMGPAWQELLDVTSAATPDGRVAPVGGKVLWDEEWVRRFQRAGQVDYVQNAQNEIAVRCFVEPNLVVARWLGLDSPRGLALLLDRCIHMGIGGGLAFVMHAVGPVQSEADRARALAAVGASDLRQFQQRHVPHLVADGLWGSRTHAAMTSALRALGNRSPLPVPSREVMIERLVSASRGRSFEARVAALAAQRPELDDTVSYAMTVA